MDAKLKKILMISVASVLVVVAVVLVFRSPEMVEDELLTEEVCGEEAAMLYGLLIDNYDICSDVVKSGESLSVILGRYGLSASAVDSLQRICTDVFDVRTIRAGNNYKVLLPSDSSARRLCHFVYEKDLVNYVVMSFEDSICVRIDSKDIRTQRRISDVTINSSLWNAMVEQGADPMLALDLSDIYAWTVDFFGLQKGDNFKVIYDEKYVDDSNIGIGDIMGASFVSGNKQYYAIPYGRDNNGRLLYWDEKGNSLRKTILKAPLKFSRISSKFSNSRLHPVLKIYRPHHGVDYAAPTGTEVYAVASGTITQRNYTSGGGNTIKIKHVHGGLESAYLHLSKFAKGITLGKRVEQGDLIGYVGSTGLSTGPHLDFRIWKNGQPIDPLKVPSEPVEPIPAADSAHFMRVRDMILQGLDGQYALDDINLSKDSASLYYSWNGPR